MIPESVQIAICTFFIVVCNSTQGIVVPLMAINYTSLYFILLMKSVQFLIIYGIIYICIVGKDIKLPAEKKTILCAGVFNGLMGMCTIYASNPTRTPAVMQPILGSLAIIPSFIMSRFLLNKRTEFNKYMISLSLFFLASSVVIGCIPLYSKWEPTTFGWILLYAFGICCMSGYCVMQEKYMIDTNDFSLKNKITIVFYTRAIQTCVVLSLFWADFVIGYEDDFFGTLKSSAYAFSHTWFNVFLMELFVIACICAYAFSIHMNSISSNYNMITTAATGPSVALFFTIFSSFNPGVKYPYEVVIPALLCNVISIILWVKGETKLGYNADEYAIIEDA